MSEFWLWFKANRKGWGRLNQKTFLKRRNLLEEKFPLPDPKTKIVLNKPKGIAVKADKLW